MQSLTFSPLRGFNKYDFFLFLTAAVLCCGSWGGSLTISRVVALALAPMMFQRMKYCNFYAGTFVKWFAAFYFFCLISMLWTPDKAEGFKELAYYFVHFCIFFEVIIFARFARRPLRSLAWGWMAMALLCSVIAVWEISTGQHLSFVDEEADSVNVYGNMVEHLVTNATFPNYNSFVTILIFCFPWLFYVMSQHKWLSLQWMMPFIILISGMIFITLNASRGGFISYSVMALLYVCMRPKSVLKTMIVCVSIIIIGKLLWNYSEQMTQILVMRLDNTSMSSADNPRLAIWAYTIRTWLDYLGVGCGVGGAQVAMAKFANGGITIPHNIFLEILVQYGPVFCIAFIVLLLKQLKISWRLQDKKRRMVLLMAILLMPVYGIIDSGYLLGEHLFVLIATIYVFANIERIQSQRPIIR